MHSPTIRATSAPNVRSISSAVRGEAVSRTYCGVCIFHRVVQDGRLQDVDVTDASRGDDVRHGLGSEGDESKPTTGWLIYGVWSRSFRR